MKTNIKNPFFRTGTIHHIMIIFQPGFSCMNFLLTRKRKNTWYQSHKNYAGSGEYNLSDKLNSSGEIQQKCLAFDHAALMSNQEG